MTESEHNLWDQYDQDMEKYTFEAILEREREIEEARYEFLKAMCRVKKQADRDVFLLSTVGFLVVWALVSYFFLL